MKRINYVELTEKFNTLRMAEKDNIFNATSMMELMRSIGINKMIFYNMANLNIFPKERIGNNVMYKMPKEPLFKEKMKVCCTITKKDTSSNKKEAAITYLKNLGYRILAPTSKFDLERLKEEDPETYSRYVKYDEI